MESLIAWVVAYKYAVLIPGAIIEGPILSMIAGLLIRLNYLDLVPAYLLLMAGDLIGDAMWYALGFYWGKNAVIKYGRFFSITEENLNIVSRIYHKHHNKIIIISKLCMGFGFPGAVLTTAGISKVPFRKFMLLNFIGQIFWSAGLIAIGYFLGDAYLRVNKGFEIFSVVGIVIAVLAVLFGLGRYIRKRTLEKYS